MVRARVPGLETEVLRNYKLHVPLRHGWKAWLADAQAREVDGNTPDLRGLPQPAMSTST